MTNLLNTSNTKQPLPCELTEIEMNCCILRANQEKSSVREIFSKIDVVLPKPTEIVHHKQPEIVHHTQPNNVLALGVSIDESWWLFSKDSEESDFFQQLSAVVQEHEQDHSLAVIDSTSAYKKYAFNGTIESMNELLSHLIPYDWEKLSRQTESRVVSTMMQSVPITICKENDKVPYTLLVRRSFADYAVDLMQRTVQLVF